MARGGKREGAGRKRKGITRKVSLTLLPELWEEIDLFNGTVADYICSLRVAEKDNKLKKVTQFEKSEYENDELTRTYIDYYWEIYKDDFLRENEATEISINDAYHSLINVMFLREETAQIETSSRYRSPFSGKWFSSMKNLLKTEVPRLITNAEARNKRKYEKEKQAIKSEEIKKMNDLNLSKRLSR